MLILVKGEPAYTAFDSTQHLSYWSCVCGSVVAPHSCSEELAAKGKKTLVSAVDEFEHFGHGGAGMLNLVFAH